MPRLPRTLTTVACVAVAIGAWLAVVEPNLLSEAERSLVTRPTTAPPTQASPATAPRQAAPPTANAFLTVMSDADLTQAAAGSFPQTVSGVTVSDPDVRVGSDGVRLTASARVFFGTTAFVLHAIPSASDGRLTIRVDAATLAGMSLPDSTRASITETLESTISQLIPADVRVTGVRLAPGVLTVEGTRP